MKQARNFLLILIAFVMAVSLVACGSTQQSATTPTTTQSREEIMTPYGRYDETIIIRPAVAMSTAIFPEGQSQANNIALDL